MCSIKTLYIILQCTYQAHGKCDLIDKQNNTIL